MICFIIDSLRFDYAKYLELDLRLYSCYANSNTTEASVSTIVTGKHPFEHEVIATGQRGDELSNISLKSTLYVGAVGRLEKIKGLTRVHQHYLFENLDKIQKWINEYKYIFIHLMEVHDYLYKPETKVEWHRGAKIVEEVVKVEHPSWTRTCEKWIYSVGNDFVKECYKYTVERVGEIINKVLEKIDLDKVTVIVTSDHGEWLGENGLWFRHSIGLDDIMVKVPLLTNLEIDGRIQHIHIRQLMSYSPNEDIHVSDKYVAVEGTWNIGIRVENRIRYLTTDFPMFKRFDYI